MSMGPIHFDVELFHSDQPESYRKVLLWLMEALAQANTEYIKRNKGQSPELYSSGVVYKRDPIGIEIWKDIPAILKDGSGDCEDLASWRVAELRSQGVEARPYIKWKSANGKTVYHALVWVKNKQGKVAIEDPSLALGMRGKMHHKPMYVKP